MAQGYDQMGRADADCIGSYCDMAGGKASCDRVPVGFNSQAGDKIQGGATLVDADVPAGATVTVNLEPAQPLNVKSIVITSKEAENFDVLDVIVGAKSVLPTQERGIPGEMMSEVAELRFTSFRAVPPVIGMKMVVRNNDADPHPFRAGLWVNTTVPC